MGVENGHWPFSLRQMNQGVSLVRDFLWYLEPTSATAPRTKTGMTEPLLKRLLERCCPHRFSWPHNGAHGQDYQVCLICGAAYEYDCTTMRRTGRLVAPVSSPYESVPKKPLGK